MATPSTPKFKSWIRSVEHALITKNKDGEYPVYTQKELMDFVEKPRTMIVSLEEMFNCETWPDFSGHWPMNAKLVKVDEDSYQVQIA